MALMEERRASVGDNESERAAPAAASAYLVSEGAVLFPLSHTSAESSRTVTVGSHTLHFPAVAPEPPGLTYEYAKRVGDVLVASLVLLVLFVPLVLVALAIYLEDRGPIFYYQMRVGKDGQLFRFYKFRSMVRNADAIKALLEARNEASGPIFKMRNDPRITRVGKYLRRYSIDELPQLINVIRGEMSLVGPRPHLPSEVALYNERQQTRLMVQPGLLCLREVFGRSNMSFEHWVELDLIYIQYRSFQTDMRILLRTLPAILKAEGAY